MRGTVWSRGRRDCPNSEALLNESNVETSPDGAKGKSGSRDANHEWLAMLFVNYLNPEGFLCKVRGSVLSSGTA